MKSLLGFILSICLFGASAANPLPSWNEGPARQAITSFVEKTTQRGSPDFVDPEKRIAVFDNDGTLWSEQPVYVQMAFIVDRIRAMAKDNPEWKNQQPFKAVLEGDLKALMKTGDKGLVQLIGATHAGMSVDEFHDMVLQWLATARHPKTGRLYTEMVYQPMVELLAYLREHGYKTYIVSGGGVEFMRPWVEKVYGIPPEQVIGSTIKTRYEIQDGVPRLVRLPEINFIDDKSGKPVGINQHIGRRPVMAFGNSDGDLQMLQWTTAAKGPRLGAIVHHTDDVREVAYDRKSHIGKLDQALDMAPQEGWLLIDMKKDWKTVFPPS